MTLVYALRSVGLLWLGIYLVAIALMPDQIMMLNYASLLVAAGIAAFLFPGVTLVVVVASVILSPENFLFVDRYVRANFDFLGVQSLHKVLIVVALIPSIIRFGIRNPLNAGVGAIVMLYLLSNVLSTPVAGLTQAQMMKSFISLSLPFFFFSIRYNRRLIDPALLFIALLPALCVAAGFLAQLLGMLDLTGRPWEVYSREFTGAFRLSGTAISAYLAFLCFISIFVCLYQAIIYKKNHYFFIMGLAFVVLVLTGTRTPIACSILFGGFSILFAARDDLRASSKLTLGILGLAFLGLVTVLTWQNIEARFFGDIRESGINTSGRAAIWDAMWAVYSVNEWFGRGIGTGAIVLLEDRAVVSAAAHNEYLRLLVDGGIVGLAVYVIGFAFLMFRESRALERGQSIFVLGLLLAFAIYSLTDNTITAPPALVMFLALALIFAKGRAERTPPAIAAV